MTEETKPEAPPIPDQYSEVFRIDGRNDRPKYLTQENRKTLALMNYRDKDVMARLQDQWRAQGVTDVKGLMKVIDADTKQMLEGIEARRTTKRKEQAKTDGQYEVDPTNPVEMAKMLLEGMLPTLVRSNGSWWDWNGAAYVEQDDERINAAIYTFLARCVNLEGLPVTANKSMIENIKHAMSSASYRDRSNLQAPCWIDPKPDDPDPVHLLACRNGILHIPTRTLLAPDPRFFTYTAVDFDYEDEWERGDPKEWKAFLNNVWGHDPEQIDALQEVFGYYLTLDTTHQKIVELTGPSRSGKGTILRILTALIGRNNVTGATLDELTNQGFGLEGLIGKSLLAVSDSRIIGGQGIAGIVQNLLRISGEDHVSIKRKFKGNWEGQLRARIIIANNQPLALPDQANAITARIFPLQMTKSFVGAEDLHLTERLLKELPQILNWALTGYERLQARGHFVLTTTGKRIIEATEAAANPAKLFVKECCIMDPKAEILSDLAFAAYEYWQERNDIGPPKLASQFGKMLQSATNYSVGTIRHRTGDNHAQQPYYTGVTLNDEWMEKAKAHKAGMTSSQ